MPITAPRFFELDVALDAQPGQFVMVWLPRFDEKPFSLANADPVRLMVTAVGPFSRLLHTLQPGARIWLRGPYGKGFVVDAERERLALVGGGYGVAPFYWLARTHLERVAAITTITGARTARDLLFTAEFAGLDDAGHRLIATTEDGSFGSTGRVTTALEPLLEAGTVDSVLACGPHGMLEAVRSLCRGYGVSCQLSWEAYMRCAIGVCGSCEHDGHVLCLDGPVLAGE